jgi:hypothetical protein
MSPGGSIGSPLSTICYALQYSGAKASLIYPLRPSLLPFMQGRAPADVPSTARNAAGSVLGKLSAVARSRKDSMAYLQTSEPCPECHGDLKMDAGDRFLAGLSGMAGEIVGGPSRLLKNVFGGASASLRGRQPVTTWFRCVSCKKRSAICPGCSRAFPLTSTRHLAEVACTRCGADLVVKLA